MNPKVSVIVPTYNRHISVKKAIDSILSQSFQEFEIIVVDDGSTDDTKSMFASCKNSKIRYFYQKNQGLPAAWNEGIKRSNGRFIAFLDSDDYWLEGKLQAQVSFLESNHVYHGCVTGYVLHTLNGKEKIVLPSLRRTSLRSILWKNTLHLGTTFMCGRGVFDRVGLFDENLRRGQDTDWMIRYRKTFEIGVIPQALAVFTQHLLRSAEITEKSRLFFLEKHKDTLLEQGLLFYHLKTATIYTDLAYQFYRNDDFSKAGEYSRKAISAFPFAWFGLYLIWLDTHLGTRFKKKLDAIKYPKGFQ